MEDSTIIKSLREQFQICIKYLWSDQCANSPLNLLKRKDNFGTNLLKFLKKTPS